MKTLPNIKAAILATGYKANDIISMNTIKGETIQLHYECSGIVKDKHLAHFKSLLAGTGFTATWFPNIERIIIK